jgi:hypothetical protein
MNRPYFDPSAGGYCKGPVARVGTGRKDRMEPGDLSTWEFQTRVPIDYDQSMFLYIIGFIRYHDRLTPNRFIVFGRKYVPSEDRFMKVDNPDYEAQDFE